MFLLQISNSTSHFHPPPFPLSWRTTQQQQLTHHRRTTKRHQQQQRTNFWSHPLRLRTKRSPFPLSWRKTQQQQLTHHTRTTKHQQQQKTNFWSHPLRPFPLSRLRTTQQQQLTPHPRTTQRQQQQQRWMSKLKLRSKMRPQPSTKTGWIKWGTNSIKCKDWVRIITKIIFVNKK